MKWCSIDTIPPHLQREREKERERERERERVIYEGKKPTLVKTIEISQSNEYSKKSNYV